MTQSVAQKTSISEKTWRRQTDSPKWWIGFACGSVILHLLAFWLIGLYKLNSSSQGRGGSAVPIEFIEISPQKSSPVQSKAKPKPKPVPPKPANTRTNQAAKPIVPENSQPAADQSAFKPPVSTNDRDAIAFNNQKIEQQLAEQQRQQKLLQQQQFETEQRQREAEQQRQLEAEQRQLAEELRQRQEQQNQLEAQLRQQEQEQQRQLEAKIRQQEQEQKRQLEAQRQQEKADEQSRLAQQSKLEAEEQRQSEIQRREADARQQPLPSATPPGQPGGQVRVGEGTSLEKLAQANGGQQKAGTAIASWQVEADEHQQKKDTITPTGGNLAKPIGSVRKKELDLSSLNTEINSQPIEFQASLIIDSFGNFEDVWINPDIKEPQRSQYREYAMEIFQDVKFQPAQESDGRKPELSNLVVLIKIQQGS